MSRAVNCEEADLESLGWSLISSDFSTIVGSALHRSACTTEASRIDCGRNG